MENLKKNIVYQIAFQLLVTALPLITAPYVSRVLGVSGMGIYSYSFSIVNYFVILSMLGFKNYGSRSIAMLRSDTTKLSKTFLEIYILQIVSSFLMLLAYLIYIFYFNASNMLVALIQSIWIISCFTDINWFYFGLEKVKVTVTRNLIVKFITVFSTFIFVNNENDLWKYTLIMALGTLLSQFFLIVNLPKYIKFTKVNWNGISSHFKPTLILLVPILSMSIYHTMDKTMLGSLSTYTQAGYYHNADKLVNIPMGIIGGIGIVMLPRVSLLLADGKSEKINEILFKSFNLVMFLSSAIAFGISTIAYEFTTLFFGAEYAGSIPLIQILAFVIYFKAWSDLIRSQYLIPFKKEKIYIYSVIVAAIVNLILNLYLIPRYGALGAVIGTITAEAIVSALQFYFVRKILPLYLLFKTNIFYFFAGLLMLIITRIIVNILTVDGWLLILIEVITGGSIFIVLCIIYWFIQKDDLFYPMIKKFVFKLKN